MEKSCRTGGGDLLSRNYDLLTAAKTRDLLHLFNLIVLKIIIYVFSLVYNLFIGLRFLFFVYFLFVPIIRKKQQRDSNLNNKQQVTDNRYKQSNGNLEENRRCASRVPTWKKKESKTVSIWSIRLRTYIEWQQRDWSKIELQVRKSHKNIFYE